jgi:hypothetical protein
VNKIGHVSILERSQRLNDLKLGLDGHLDLCPIPQSEQNPDFPKQGIMVDGTISIRNFILMMAQPKNPNFKRPSLDAPLRYAAASGHKFLRFYLKFLEKTI